MTSPETDGTRQGERSAARRAEQESSWFDRALVPPTPVVADPASGQSPTSLGSTAPGPGPGPAPGPVPGGVEDDDLLDENWAAPRRTNRLTALLAVGIVAVAGFAGGAWVQRSHDAGLTAGAGALAGAGRTGGQFPSGFPSGGFAGFGQPGAGQGQAGGAASGGTAGAGSAGATATTTAPVVVGTVDAVAADTVTVKNFGGQAVVVKVSATTSVTSVGLGGLTAGATVAVFGTKAADGTVTAASIVSRKAG